MRRRFASWCVLALALGSCGGGDREAAQTRPPPTSTPAPTPCTVPDGSTEARSSETTPPTALVTDVRYNAQDCPRVVFEFRDQEPGYTISYVSPPFSECGSGEEVSTAGWGATAFLQVRMEPAASADQEQPGAPQTYDGPRDIRVRGRVLKHLKVICDFEAQFVWLVGLDERHDFLVTTLDDPSRLVIDISET